MTSASYPVSATPAPSQQSFLVHLQLLTDISRELQTQVEGIAKPLDSVATLLTDPPAFGPVGAASTLQSWSQDAAAQMQGLISDVRAALGFADEVTRTVATGYAQADDDISWGIGGHSGIGGSIGATAAGAGAAVGTVVGVVRGTVGQAAGAVGGLAAGLTHTAGQLTGTVGESVHGVTDAVGGTVQDVTDAVPAGSIVGALTGQPRGGVL